MYMAWSVAGSIHCRISGEAAWTAPSARPHTTGPRSECRSGDPCCTALLVWLLMTPPRISVALRTWAGERVRTEPRRSALWPWWLMAVTSAPDRDPEAMKPEGNSAGDHHGCDRRTRDACGVEHDETG